MFLLRICSMMAGHRWCDFGQFSGTLWAHVGQMANVSKRLPIEHKRDLFRTRLTACKCNRCDSCDSDEKHPLIIRMVGYLRASHSVPMPSFVPASQPQGQMCRACSGPLRCADTVRWTIIRPLSQPTNLMRPRSTTH